MTLWTAACQAPLFRGFSKEEYWHGLCYPSLGDLPNIGMEPVFPALADGFFTTESPGKPWRFLKILKIELLYDPAIPRWGIYPEKIMIPKN